MDDSRQRISAEVVCSERITLESGGLDELAVGIRKVCLVRTCINSGTFRAVYALELTLVIRAPCISMTLIRNADEMESTAAESHELFARRHFGYGIFAVS